MGNQAWMAMLSSDLCLRDIVLPGSHDAGVYGNSLTSKHSPKAWARCQGSNLFEQAARGSRMFDLRVFLKKEATGIVPTMGHFFREKAKNKAGETGDGGAYGGGLITCLSDALAFVKTYQTECLVLRFSHTYCAAEVGAALSEFVHTKNNLSFVCRAGGNLAARSLRQLRGKIVMVFDMDHHSGFEPRDGYLKFSKYTGAAPTEGLCTCGPYKGSGKMSSVYATVAQGFADHKAHAGAAADHLHFVYWQQTLKPGDVEAATTKPNSMSVFGKVEQAYTGGAHPNLKFFIDEIREKVAAGQWRRPNIISHDFVNDDTCRQIIALNPGIWGT